jgi:hypothetical protein
MSTDGVHLADMSNQVALKPEDEAEPKKRRNGTGTPRRHAHAQRGNDLYETPVEAVAALLHAEQVPQDVWEPACGPGKIVDELRASGRHVVATDLVDYKREGSLGGVDFLMEQSMPPNVKCIVTNPPYMLAEKFVWHARDMADVTIMLLRFNFLASRRRRGLFSSKNLKRVWLFENRLPRMHRDGWTGNKVSSQVEFGWFVWDKSYHGWPEMRWLNWRDAIPHVKTPGYEAPLVKVERKKDPHKYTLDRAMPDLFAPTMPGGLIAVREVDQEEIDRANDLERLRKQLIDGAA